MKWNAENIEDLKAYHGFDVVAQLEAILAEEISREKLKFNRYTYDYQHLAKYYENVPIMEERKTNRIFNDIDPYGEENWNE